MSNADEKEPRTQPALHLTPKQWTALHMLAVGRHHMCNLSTVKQLAAKGLACWSGEKARTGFNRTVRWTAALTKKGRSLASENEGRSYG